MAPPDGLPSHQLITGPDDASSCRRVSEAMALGHRLHGGPAPTWDGRRVPAGQALVWPDDGAG
jgi:hypothetical protein